MILGQEIIYTFAMFISKSMDYQNLSDEQFKRRFGVYKQTYIAFLIHKRYIPDPEQLNQQRFKCAAQMREPL